MKKYLLLLTTVVVLLSSCKKQEGYYINAAAANTGSMGTTPGGTGNTAADTYQPVTANSYWRYHNGTDSSLTTSNGTSSTINSKQYYAVVNTSNTYSGPQSSFFGINNHYYSSRGNTLINGITIDMVYLNDALPAGSNFTSKLTDSGNVNGVPAQTITTILETGITRTVLSKTFRDVIHTKVDLQYDYGPGLGIQTDGTYEFYVAKNIGIIETSAVVYGITTPHTYLASYSIK